ncbi:ABC transporter permease [Anaerocolumna xylanovorans]|uniref:Putative ABC transport system permease protein n=1 Tax=Anaerocolumna xylanovorans DSM 12503 TaxID=1121345 RepID=A0A1M7YFV1_9FIRM|nr:ABC transporter permease [Anaerocolumna xylanovorans]SHO51456.1 putative ABC transport system permease protein [Anaerocolumna xylanovorans DSM 12503]
MKVFLKYVLRSMTEKKGRFFLLIIAISISMALLVASTGMIDIILDSIVAPQLESYENKDIVINSTDKSSYFYSDEGLNTKGLDEKSISKELYLPGSMADKAGTDEETMLTVIVRGREKAYINQKIITEGDLKNFDGESCIISERTADKRNLKLNDTIKAVIGGATKSFKIRAISGTAGVFYSDSKDSFTVIVPYEYLSKDLGAEGKYNLILADSGEKTIKEGIDTFNAGNKMFTAEKLFDEDMVKDQTASFKALLYVMLIVVVVMSSIIIYSSFKLIITERLSTIGAFLSQGATVGKVKFILYLESFTYGVFGALLGNGLGIAALYVINRMISPLKEYGIYGIVVIEPAYIIIGTVFAIVLSIISASLPVRKISKLQVKDIILNDVRITKAIGWKKFIIGIIMLAGSLAAYLIFKEELKGFSAIVLVVSLSGLIFAYPKLIDLISGYFYRLFRGKSKNVIYAINNLRTSKILLGNISLIIISLTSIITIASLGASMINVVTEAYTKLVFDVEIDNISTVRENAEESTTDYLVRELNKMGIEDEEINRLSFQQGELRNETDLKVPVSVMGINPDTYVEYNRYLQLDKAEYKKYLDNLGQDEDGVIITTVLSKKTGKRTGDNVEVTCNGLKQTLKVAGVVDGKLFNNGYFILVKLDTLKEFFAVPFANTITFNTDKDIDKVMKDLKPVLREVGAKAITREEMCEKNLEANEMLVNALSIFSYMAIIIAGLGIVNNVSISFLQRKKEFAVLASVGMENTGRTKIIFFESIASVTWAMLLTIIYSFFGLRLISIMTKSIGFDMDIVLDGASLPLIYAISLGIVLIATVPVYFRSRKLSIIQELKYE